MSELWETEIQTGSRFAFGANWQRFLRQLNDGRIIRAARSIQESLQVESLKGRSFLDIGCGSGLFSLAARRLGARVMSVDIDPQSIACTEELRARYFPSDPEWRIERGSVLDKSFLSTVGRFEIVYSWGVLHHTGQMWQALENAGSLVIDGGSLFISIYNDPGSKVRRWRGIKRLFNKAPTPLRALLILGSMIRLWGPTILLEGLKGRPIKWLRQYGSIRGMSPLTDLIDWVGGYPYEFAKPEEIFQFYDSRGFILKGLKTCAGGMGCNEFIFTTRPRS